ncbi:MAG: hypothetical protein ACYDC0_11465, partial [Acidimicrobiales bacterium]
MSPPPAVAAGATRRVRAAQGGMDLCAWSFVVLVASSQPQGSSKAPGLRGSGQDVEQAVQDFPGKRLVR